MSTTRKEFIIVGFEEYRITSENMLNTMEPDSVAVKLVKEYKWFILFVGGLITGYLLLVAFSGMLMPISVVRSESMLPAIAKGDLIALQAPVITSLGVGDVIVFQAPPGYPSPMIHRIVDEWVQNDATYFRTKGDNNPVPDSFSIPATNVIAEYTGIRVPYVGYLVLFIQTPQGTIVFVGLVVLWLAYEYLVREDTAQLDGSSAP
jgi:signal peptidase